MPVNFLTDEQNQTYARYPEQLTQEQLDKYFYLDDKDKELIDACRRDGTQKWSKKVRQSLWQLKSTTLLDGLH